LNYFSFSLNGQSLLFNLGLVTTLNTIIAVINNLALSFVSDYLAYFSAEAQVEPP